MIVRNVKVVYKDDEAYCFVAVAPTLEDFERIIHDISSSSDVLSVSY